MPRYSFLLVALAAVLAASPAFADGSLTYRARVVHDNRSQLSVVSGRIDLGSGNFVEEVEQSYLLNWQQIPGGLEPTRPALPTIWRANEHTARRRGQAMPRFDSPLLRHFIVSQVIAGTQDLAVGDEYLSGQLVIDSIDYSISSFEVVASFRGMPLVIVGRYRSQEGHRLVEDLAVLGPSSELYQYFFESIAYSPEPLAQLPELPVLNSAEYVDFPQRGADPVAIRPIKDWLVFQAQLPNGRPLNLVLDSGAETMVLDELVLKVDALLEPVGKLRVAGALETEDMNLYEGFSFEVGGVRFSDLQVVGTQLTSLSVGAGMRIHGIVGGEILQLCRLDIDLDDGLMRLAPPASAAEAAGEGLELTFISDLPHIQAQVQDTGAALLLLDTGQRSALSVNLDWLDHYELGDQLKLNGFLGDISGGLMPRYIVENLDLSLAGHTYREKVADAGMSSTFSFNGLPVVGTIGFPLLARHYGGMTFDYRNKLLYLRDPADERVFAGRPDAWIVPDYQSPMVLADAGERDSGIRLEETEDYDYAVALVTSAGRDPRRPQLMPDRDPLSDDPRSGYAWTGQSGSVADPLTLVRSSQPGLDFFGKRNWSQWTAQSDPRWQPLDLPDRGAAEPEPPAAAEEDPAAAPSPAEIAQPVLEPVAEEAATEQPTNAAAVPAAGVGDVLSRLAEGWSKLDRAGEAAVPPAAVSEPALPADREAQAREFALRLGGIVRERAELFLERVAMAEAAPQAGEESPVQPVEPVYPSGLGGSEKRSDYEFSRDHPRLNFR